MVKNSDVGDANTRTPAIENKTSTLSLRDTLALMKRIKNYFKLEVKENGKAFWNDVFIQPFGEYRISIKNQEFDINPGIQIYFFNTKLITKFLDKVEEETVFDLLENVGFYDNIPKIGLKSATMQDVLYNLPNVIAKIRNLPQPTTENVSDSDLEGQGPKIIIPSKIFAIYIRLENLLRLRLSGHTDTLTKAIYLLDE